MIFVIECADPLQPRAWFAYDGDDLLRKVAADDALPWWRIHDEVSAGELLSMVDEAPGADGVGDRHPAIVELGQAHGWDTPLYRADYLLEPGTYQPQAVDPLDAAHAALKARGPTLFYRTESEATAAFERADDPAWNGNGWRSRWALREQLLALEVLADDL